MAAINRPTKATYEVHEEVTVDTTDHEDHSFCGIMFPVKCKDLLPLEYLVIKSVSVRGALGPITVWVSNDDSNNGRQRHPLHTEYRFPLAKRHWTKVYDQTHKASFRHYKDLVFDQPIKITPGKVKAIYIHSTLPSDEAIIYDNTYYGSSNKRYEDEKLSIMTGRAHVSPVAFSNQAIWGWGNAWRDRREFVGQLSYGTVYKLWNPQTQPKFGSKFQNGARLLFLCQRRWESPFSLLPDDCIFYILNMCRWDWFDDDAGGMKQRRKQEKARLASQKLVEGEKTAAAAAVAVAAGPCTSGTMHLACAKRQVFIEDDDDDDDDDNAKGDAMDSDTAPVNASGNTDSGMDLVDTDEDEDENGDEWESEDEDDEDEDQYHSASERAFTYNDIDSDAEDEGDDEDDEGNGENLLGGRTYFLRRHVARFHLMRAFASMGDGDD